MTTRKSQIRTAITPLLVLVALSFWDNGGAQQNSDDKPVVISATLKTSGYISGEFHPVDNAKAQVQGGCNESFANFGLIYEDKTWRKVSVTVMTKDGISSSQVGPIALDWALVSFMDSSYDATQFKGPAQFIISKHDAATSRMVGTVKGSLPGYGGLMGGDVPPDQSIDFEFTFEMIAACGSDG